MSKSPRKEAMGKNVSYAQPGVVTSIDDCFFYHVMDLPGDIRVGGQWDLRPTVAAYLGHFDFRGKRVLDVGAASGFLTFSMERRGATVVSFDMGKDQDWDVAPFDRGFDIEEALESKRKSRKRLVNTYWYAHRALGSKARAFYGNIYDIPQALGSFDVVVMGAVLLHLRDPFLGLYSASRLSREHIIVVDYHFDSETPVMEFLPNLETQNVDTWWRISESCVSAMLEVLGFERPTITRSKHLCLVGEEHEIDLSTYVARCSR